jgi:hypothetical protein
VNLRALPPQLHATAEAAVSFFKADRGISNFRTEEAVSDDLDYRPTLQAVTREHHDLWVEVSETPYLSSLDNVVLHCVKNCIPVKLFVAFPAGLPPGEYKRRVDEARNNGVGVVEVSAAKTQVIHEAQLLSLMGARFGDRSQFPLRYRSVLSNSEATFKNGDPAKACALIYDEIEQLSRRLAKRVAANNWWTHMANGAPNIRPDKDHWGPLMDTLLARANFQQLPAGLKRNLLLRVAALTDVRNDTGHKPRNRAAYVKRDTELRTRLESAIDVLRDFAKATRSLRL